ncbi:MAG: hypothetical protein ABR540_22965, partial [Acidimicrobiales bacterium]
MGSRTEAGHRLVRRTRAAARNSPRAADALLSLGFLVLATVAVYVDVRIRETSDPSYQPPGVPVLALTT